MDAYTVLDIEGARNGEMKPRVSNVALEITRGCRLTLEWDEMFARYVISLSTFKLEEHMFCGKNEYNAFINIKRLIKPVSKIY